MVNRADTGAEHPKGESQPEVEGPEPDSTRDYALERAEQRELKRRAALELRELLDDKPVRLIVEYLADRLHCVGGHRRMGFWLEQGSLRQSEFGHERLRNAELEIVGRREAPSG